MVFVALENDGELGKVESIVGWRAHVDMADFDRRFPKRGLWVGADIKQILPHDKRKAVLCVRQVSPLHLERMLVHCIFETNATHFGVSGPRMTSRHGSADDDVTDLEAFPGY